MNWELAYYYIMGTILVISLIGFYFWWKLQKRFAKTMIDKPMKICNDEILQLEKIKEQNYSLKMYKRLDDCNAIDKKWKQKNRELNGKLLMSIIKTL